MRTYRITALKFINKTRKISYMFNCSSEQTPNVRNKPHENQTIAAQLRQRHWGFTTAGFVLEPGTMLNSMSPILHLCTLSALINQKCNHVSETAFSSSPVSSFSLFLIIRAWSSSYDNCVILRHGMCLKAPHALWLLGESKRQLSVAHCRQVTAEWPNCLSCCLSRAAKPPISLIITEKHGLLCSYRSNSAQRSMLQPCFWAASVSNKTLSKCQCCSVNVLSQLHACTDQI